MKTLARWLGVATLLLLPAWGGGSLQAQEYPGDDLPQMSLDDSRYDPRDSLPLPDAPLPDVGGIRNRDEVSFYDPSGGPVDADGMEEGDDGEAAGASGGGQSYTIKKGDTLGSISRKFFGTTKHWKKIAAANGIKNPASLKVGRVVTIPSDLGPVATKRTRSKATYRAPTYRPPALPAAPPPPLPPPPGASRDLQLYSDKGLPSIMLPETDKKRGNDQIGVTMEGLTGLTRTFAAYPLGKGLFSTSFGVVWNKITKRDNNRLQNGEDADYWQFPMAITYSGEGFEGALVLPFESYDVYAPLTYNFRDGTDSGMGDAALRLKFSSQNENMASCIGVGAIFPTNDRRIGNTDNDNAWEVFGGVSTRKKEGGNMHLNGGYQASAGNTSHEGVFVNVGFEYNANPSFTFMGEINSYNRVNDGRATDLTLSMRYHVKPGMSLTLAAPISLQNEMFFGYDYRLQGQLQYHY